MPRKQKPRGVAEALDHAQTVIKSARAARERSAEMLLHRHLAKIEREPVEIDPATEATLRDRLTK